MRKNKKNSIDLGNLSSIKIKKIDKIKSDPTLDKKVSKLIKKSNKQIDKFNAAEISKKKDILLSLIQLRKCVGSEDYANLSDEQKTWFDQYSSYELEGLLFEVRKCHYIKDIISAFDARQLGLIWEASGADKQKYKENVQDIVKKNHRYEVEVLDANNNPLLVIKDQKIQFKAIFRIIDLYDNQLYHGDQSNLNNAYTVQPIREKLRENKYIAEQYFIIQTFTSNNNNCYVECSEFAPTGNLKEYFNQFHEVGIGPQGIQRKLFDYFSQLIDFVETLPKNGFYPDIKPTNILIKTGADTAQILFSDLKTFVEVEQAEVGQNNEAKYIAESHKIERTESNSDVEIYVNENKVDVKIIQNHTLLVTLYECLTNRMPEKNEMGHFIFDFSDKNFKGSVGQIFKNIILDLYQDSFKSYPDLLRRFKGVLDSFHENMLEDNLYDNPISNKSFKNQLNVLYSNKSVAFPSKKNSESKISNNEQNFFQQNSNHNPSQELKETHNSVIQELLQKEIKPTI